MCLEGAKHTETKNEILNLVWKMMYESEATANRKKEKSESKLESHEINEEGDLIKTKDDGTKR